MSLKSKLFADPVLTVYAGLIIFALMGTFVSMSNHVQPGPIKQIVGLATSLTATVGICLAWGRHLGFRKAFWSLIAVLLLGSSLEILGLATGWPFGRYVYTDAWWPSTAISKVGLFPLLLPFAWLTMTAGGFVAGQKISSGWVGVLCGGLVVALSDAPMEAIMTRVLHYWQWNQPGEIFGAPVSNFLSWWAVSCIAGGLFYVASKKVPPATMLLYLCGQLVLTGGLGLMNRLLAPGFALVFLAGCLIFLWHLALPGDQPNVARVDKA